MAKQLSEAIFQTHFRRSEGVLAGFTINVKELVRGVAVNGPSPTVC